MTEAIRVLHFADVHVGMENYGKTDPDSGLSSRVVDFLHRMDEMVAYARDNDVDLIIFAGDAFKTRTPNPTYQREFAWRMRDLSDLAPLVMLVGNHDLPPSAIKASSIEIYDTLRVPNIHVAQDYDVIRVTTKRGDVMVGCAPYPIRARLMRHMDDTSISIRESDHMLESALTDILDDLAQRADEQGGEDVPRLLTGHFSIHGAVTGSERGVMLGRDVQVSLPLLADPRWDYVAMGHIHKHQNLTHGRDDLPPVVYSGSLERIDFGEEADVKGFCWVELARQQTKWEFVALKARPMLTLRLDCQKDSNPTRTVLEAIGKHNLNQAIVRIILKLSPENETTLNEVTIREALKRANVFHVAYIKRDVERTDRARLAHNPEGMTHEQLLESYLINRQIAPERRDVLMQSARSIMRLDE